MGTSNNDEGSSSSKDTSKPAIPSELEEMHTVVPLTTCPHLPQVTEVPESGIDAASLCSSCHIGAEVWMCLSCYRPQCGRFVNEHALMHHLETTHPMALSLADLSVWCYPCEAYVHNPTLIPAKCSAHESKFGERMPS